MSFNPGNISKADAVAYSSSDSDSDAGDDYQQRPSADPRDDDFGDFNPRKKRRTGRNAKESAALGIFGSDSEDDGPGWKRKGKKDLRHKGMAFVSAGQQEPNEDDDEDDDAEYAETGRFGIGAKGKVPDEDEEENDEDEDEDEDMTGVGMGFRPAGQGLGWAPPTQAETPAAPTAAASRQNLGKSASKFDSSRPLGAGFVPSSANAPVLKANLEDEPSASPTPKPSAFSGGAGGKAKSFAARMMAKMGYVKGQGLGAEGQGRNLIIEPTLRPQGAGLGAVKEMSKSERQEQKRVARMRGEEVSDSDEEKKKKKKAERKKRQGLDSGTASGSSTPRRPKTKYLTVSDMQKAAPGLHIPDAFAPILDMTGPGQRMLTSGSGLLTPTAGTEVAEQTEARKLASRAQRDLVAFVEEWKTLEERKGEVLLPLVEEAAANLSLAWLDMETHQRSQEQDELQSEFASLQVFASVLDEISQSARDKEWDPIINGLRKVEGEVEIRESNDELAAIAVAAIHPFVRDAVQGWQPLEDPKLGNLVADLTSIQGVLGLNSGSTGRKAVSRWVDDEPDGTHRHHRKSTTPYESMIYKLVFPKLVTAVTQQWDAQDADSLTALFEKWDKLLPPFVRSQLLEQVVRRLEAAIASWKPRKKQHNPPHLWVFPWLEFLPTHHLDPKGTGLVADIRRKFRQLIDVWAFDRGVIPGLERWKEVFRPTPSQDQWKPLVMHHILPSMAKYLRTNFRVDPADQNPYLPMLSGIAQWTDVISSSMVAEVIAAEVFPMWHDILYQWLTSDGSSFDEIAMWYESWRSDILPKFSKEESIAAEFEKGQAMLEQAIELGTDVQEKLSPPDCKPARPAKSHSSRRPDPAVSRAVPEKATAPDAVAKSFREEIEEWCNENDLRFLPTPKSTNNGERYYRVTASLDGRGGVLAYFRKGSDVFVAETRKTGGLELFRDKQENWNNLVVHLLQ